MLNELYHFATPWAKATKRQINVNRMLGVAANALYPIYCAWSPLPKQRTTQGERMVVSLTTFPLRMDWTAEQMAKQTEIQYLLDEENEETAESKGQQLYRKIRRFLNILDRL